MLRSISKLTSKNVESIWNNFETRRTPSFLFLGPVYLQSHLLLGKQMWLQLNKNFSPKSTDSWLMFSRWFRPSMCTHFNQAWCFPFPDCIVTLFRHCHAKQTWGPNLYGHIKIVTEHFRWGLKWERIAPNSLNHAKKRKKAKLAGWYDFSDVKYSKMLSFDSVAEAHSLIYLRPLEENFSIVFLENFCPGVPIMHPYVLVSQILGSKYHLTIKQNLHVLIFTVPLILQVS